jgi:hypothetical protein
MADEKGAERKTGGQEVNQAGGVAVIQLTEKQKMLRDHMTAVELIVEHKHGGVELSDWAAALDDFYGAGAIEEAWREIEHATQ